MKNEARDTSVVRSSLPLWSEWTAEAAAGAAWPAGRTLFSFQGESWWWFRPEGKSREWVRVHFGDRFGSTVN